MCTANVDPGAQRNLAAVMTLCVRRLAELHGVDPDDITIGPVDFGGNRGEDHQQADKPT